NPQAVRQHVAAVKAYAAGLAAQGDDFLDGGAHVVGIDQERGVLWKDTQEIPEGFGLVLMRHDPGMRLRAINRNPEAAARVRVRGAFATANEGSAGGEDSGFHAVRATRAEFHDRASGGSVGDAGCFAGDKRLKMKNAEEAGFDKLRLCDGGGHAQKRFTGEKRSEERRVGKECRSRWAAEQ